MRCLAYSFVKVLVSLYQRKSRRSEITLTARAKSCSSPGEGKLDIYISRGIVSLENCVVNTHSVPREKKKGVLNLVHPKGHASLLCLTATTVQVVTAIKKTPTETAAPQPIEVCQTASTLTSTSATRLLGPLTMTKP